jgi:hypothetical protein
MILVLMAGLFIMQILFFALVGLGRPIQKSEITIGSSNGDFAGTYIIWVVVDLNANLDFLKYVTPFKYFDASVIIKNGSLGSVLCRLISRYYCCIYYNDISDFQQTGPESLGYI